jgi:ABC-type amino acid transport substrate-binding protein
LGPKFQIGEGYGVVTQLERADLIQRVNQALLSMEDDGTYLTIYQHYFPG